MTDALGSKSAKPSREGGRLEFLDAARGIAAVAVVLQHSMERSVHGFLQWSPHYVNLGASGVVMFFIVSGFIIPFSLRRTGELKTFWANRVFRLYPMYWVSLIAVLGFAYFSGIDLLPSEYLKRPIIASLVNITMLQTFVRIPDAIQVYWTLGLELVFYFFCSLLFAFGWLKRSLLWGWTAAVVMLFGVGTAGIVLHRSLPAGRLGLLVTAFLGTVIFEVSTRELPRKVLYSLVPFVFATLALGFWYRFHVYPSRAESEGWNMVGVCLSWGLAYVVFGVLFAFRKQQYPRWLTWLGRISYSLYLVHGLVLALVPQTLGPVVYIAAVLAISVGISEFTYRFVEKPAITIHRNRVRSRGIRSEPQLEIK